MPLLGRQTDFSGTLANRPKANLRVGDVYRPSNGMLPYRWNGSKHQTLNLYGVPVDDGQIHLSAPVYKWTATGAGTNEYACELIGGGDPSLSEPGSLFLFNGAFNWNEATKGTPGSLSAGTWGWGSYSGFNTVHVRLSDDSDPDTQAYGYVKADPLSWTGGAGSATAQLVAGIPLMTSLQTGSALLRARTRAVPATPWTYFLTMHPIHGLSGENGCGLCISDGTKFRAIVAYLDTGTERLRVSVYNWDTNTTGKTQLTLATGGTYVPFDLIRTHGTPMFAAVDNGTSAQFYMGAAPNNMWLMYSVARTTHLTPSRVGPCLTTVSGGDARSWFPGMYFT